MRSYLKEAYLRFAGDLADIHGETSVNGPCPFCGSADYSGHHRSDRFVLWLDRSEGIGKTCAENGIAGIYWCRQCGKSGDTISYLMEAENLEFKEACVECGIRVEGKPMKLDRYTAPAEKPKAPAFEGRPVEEPSAIWQAHTARMDEEARKALPSCRTALDWLCRKHGITLAMAEHYGLGFLPGENGKDVRFRYRSSFGLPAKIDAEGREQKKMAIRRGITIVSRNAGGDITMFRVRRPNGDVREKQGKFYELPGGSKCSFHLPPAGDPLVRVYMVVEGEMDAILLHSIAGEGIGLVATRACTNRPDAETHAALMRADLILVALDSDSAGQKGSAWWLDTYRSARPFPVPGYKDPGDAFEAGFDLRLWLESGMPRSLCLPPSIREATASRVEPEPALPPSTAPCGFLEESFGTYPSGGMGVAVESGERGGFDDVLTQEVLNGLRDVCPRYLVFDAIPKDVLVLAVLWRGTPIHYLRVNGGFEWKVPNRFRKYANSEAYARFMRLATTSRDVSDWLSAHVDADIWSGNFLNVCGEGE